jgi:DNA-binding CsgD family transcriptional regulator
MADETFPDLPLPAEQWKHLLKTLHLPPQQVRIVELILRNYCDKQIAAVMGIGIPTVRSYLGRLFIRFNVTNRSGLLLRIFALSQAPPQSQ